jgi:hypothetical protein
MPVQHVPHSPVAALAARPCDTTVGWQRALHDDCVALQSFLASLLSCIGAVSQGPGPHSCRRCALHDCVLLALLLTSTSKGPGPTAARPHPHPPAH